MRKAISLYIFAAILMFASNYLWAFHDFYWWDRVTEVWVKAKFGDWHYLKTLVLALFSFSWILMPKRVVYFIGLLFIRWTAFQLGCYSASMAAPYHSPEGWWSIFDLPTVVCHVVACAALVIPILIQYKRWFENNEN